MFVITKGDNNYRSDRPIRKNRIIGKVIEIKKEDRYEQEKVH